METINIEKEKLDIIQWIVGLKDESFIERLMVLKDSSSNSDWWDEISEEEKASLERGLEDFSKGKVSPHSDAKRLYEKWL